MNTLIVSGYPMLAHVISGFVSDMKLGGVDRALESQTALAKIMSGQFGIVLCDWILMSQTGIQVLNAVRTSPGVARLPFVLMFADSSREKIEAARAAGVSAWLVKPFDRSILRAAMESALAFAVRA